MNSINKNYKINISNSIKFIDKKNLVIFLKRLFKNINFIEWEWEYTKSPNTSYIFTAEHNRKIIGHSALIGLELKNNLNTIIFYKFEGSLVDIEYIKKTNIKNKRVFLEIILNIIDFQKKNKLDFIFGFPSKTALPSQLKGGFNYEKIDILVYNYFISYQIKFKNKFKFFHNFKILKLIDLINKIFLISSPSSDFKFEQFNENHIQKLNIFNDSVYKKYKDNYTIYKNYKYIKWKYLENKTSIYKIYTMIKKNKIYGIIGVKIENNKLHVIDLEYLDVKSLVNILKFLKKYSFKHELNHIEFWMDPKDNYFTKLIFILNGFILQYRLHKDVIFSSLVRRLSFKKIFISKSFLR